MAHLVRRGLVLREADYKESDKILTVLLEGEGKRTVKSSGCRRKNSALAAASQLLVWSEMTLFEFQDRLNLKEAATLREFRGVREDLAKLALASYFAECAEAGAEEGVETPGLLPLVLNSLHALDRMDRPPALVKGAFELKLCCLIGYTPLLDGCAVCGRPEPERPRLHLDEGVLLCAACRGEEGASLPLDGPALAAMRHVARGDPKRLFSFSLPPGSGEAFARACESFFLARMDRRFKTLEFYKSLQM